MYVYIYIYIYIYIYVCPSLSLSVSLSLSLSLSFSNSTKNIHIQSCTSPSFVSDKCTGAPHPRLYSDDTQQTPQLQFPKQPHEPHACDCCKRPAIKRKVETGTTQATPKQAKSHACTREPGHMHAPTLQAQRKPFGSAVAWGS